jgi:hypothetical protein
MGQQDYEMGAVKLTIATSIKALEFGFLSAITILNDVCPMTLKLLRSLNQRRSRMNTSVAGDFETPRPSHRGGAKKAAIVVAKLLVTGACFWYLSRQIDWRQVLSTIPLLDLRWAALAILVAMLEIPLAGLRWYNIVDALAARHQQMTWIAMTAATAVGVFFQ